MNRPIAQAIQAIVFEAQPFEQIGGCVRRQQIDLTAQKGRAKAHGKLVAIGAQVHDVAPVREQIGEPPDLPEKLFDAYRASVPKGENRTRVEIANQRNISHDATAGRKPPRLFDPMLLNVLTQAAEGSEDLAVLLVV